MKKNKFLKDLEQKLIVLSEEERKDIINEYRDIIEEKVKHGKTEEEAVKEFGGIDNLATEILSTYKINPDYGKEKKDIKFEDHIENGAKKLSEWTSSFVDSVKNKDVDLTLEDVFKIAIKIILLLLLLMLLKLPFYILGELGESFINLGYMPFDGFMTVLWKVVLSLFYIGLCIFVIVVSASKMINVTPKDDNKKKETKKTIKSEVKEEVKKEIKKEKEKKIIIFL